MTTLNEEKKVATSYITSFLQNVYALNQLHATFTNVILEIKYLYPDEEKMEQMPKQHQEVMKSSVQNLRNIIQQTYIQYASIKASIKKEEEDKKEQDPVKIIYDQIIEGFMIKIKQSEEYTILINNFLTDKVVKTLLDNTQEIMEEMYE